MKENMSMPLNGCSYSEYKFYLSKKTRMINAIIRVISIVASNPSFITIELGFLVGRQKCQIL